jgi:DNA-binding transcriptional LysR family regulator
MTLTDEMQNRLHNRPALRGILRLGAADSFALTCLPGLLRRLEVSYPVMQVELNVDHSVNLGRALNRRELDMAFLVDPRIGDHAKIESVCRIRLIWIAGPNYKLARGTLAPQHLQHEQVLTLPAPSTSYAIIDNWFARAGLQAKKVSTCNSMNMIVSLAVASCGISVVPMCIVLQELRAGLLKKIPVNPELPSHSLFVAYQSSRFKSGLREIAAMGREEVARHEAFRGTV